MIKKKMYRQDPLISCFVPNCKSKAIMSPEKYFFYVPLKNREQWCAAVHKPNVPKGALYICEDHINPETDLLNYTTWKDGNARARLNPTVPDLKNILKQSAGQLEPESLNLESTSGTSCTQQGLTKDVGTLCTPDFRNKSIQVKTITKEKGVRVNIKPNIINQHKIEEPSDDTVSVIDNDSTSEFSENDASTDTKPDTTLIGRQFLLNLVQKDPVHYIGIPKPGLWIVEYLAKYCKEPQLHIIIVLYKIKNNDTFLRIGDLFQISETTLWRFFYKTLNILKSFLEQLVYWPAALLIKKNLPLPFRVNSEYSNVQCIVDCFEIEIEKPKDPVHQSLTWSQYKNCNTVKYLIGATPDGFISYISKGFGGRTSDINIVKQSGFLNKILPNSTILADRGFKNLETYLATKSSKLLRPPSVSKNIKMTKSEVINSKVIASLRVHIERVIRRVRLYKLLKPHSVVNNKITSSLDYAVITACGLINLQAPLLKNV